MSWRTVMIEQGEFLRLKLDNLYIKKASSEFSIPLSDINMVIVSNQDAVITARLLDAFTQYNISLVICDYKHQPSGIFTGLNSHSRASKVFNGQINWTVDFKEKVWRKIVRAKITNQKRVLEQSAKDSMISDRIALMENYAEDVDLGDVTNREGHAAKVYFNTLFGNEFTREDETYINACLNYIYAVVRAYFTRMIVAYGLSGMIGVHHKNEYNNFNLADDLMEPFRPYCDKYIVEYLLQNDIFDLETRIKLVDFLNYKINYNNQKTMIASVIEKYIISFLKCCQSEDIDEFKLPEIDCE